MEVYKVTSKDLFKFAQRINALKSNFFKNDLGLVDAEFTFYLSKSKEKVLIDTTYPCFDNNFQELIFFLKENLFLKPEMEVKLNVKTKITNNLLLINHFHKTFGNTLEDNVFPKELFNHQAKSKNAQKEIKHTKLHLENQKKKEKIEKEEALRIIQEIREFKQKDVKIIEKVLKNN